MTFALLDLAVVAAVAFCDVLLAWPLVSLLLALLAPLLSNGMSLLAPPELVLSA